jgi:chemotaxis protein methyltransferase CheR
MPEKFKNIIEDIASDFLNSALSLRYDICTCNQCRNEMLAYILSRVPAKYVTTEKGALHTIIEQERVEHEAEIARAMIDAIETISKNPRHTLREDKEQTFQLLLNKIFEDRGLDFRHYRQGVLKRRIAIRMHANKVESYSGYLRLLIKNPKEYEKLFDVLCINVSEFFRDPEIWVTIRYLLENLIRNKKQRNDKSIRIWSGGCAGGEEPYSVAILLKEILKDDLSWFSLEIIGTDIDRKSLSTAETAEYPKERLKNVDAKILKKYFVACSGGYKLNAQIKDMVGFQYQDLISQDFIEETDLVLCRNVFIYFNRSLQEQLLMKLYKCLKAGGYLIMGKVETILQEAKGILEEIDVNACIYRKK